MNNIRLHIKRKLILLASFFLVLMPATAQDSDADKALYSGGMLFFQPGYAMTENQFQKIQRPSWGIGGILRFYMWDYITVGLYGGSQKIKYPSSGSDNSSIGMGYGGAFVGLSHKYGKFRYSASAFVGIGTLNNLHIEKQHASTLTEAYLYKNRSLLLSPLVSIDYSLTKRLAVTAQGVFLSGKNHENKPFHNPVFQIGILFSR